MSRLIKTPPPLKLVRKHSRWEICFQARGRMDGRPVEAWLRYSDEQFVCKVGFEDQLENMPLPLEENFFGDPFTFAVDELDASGKRMERLAGANHVSVARAAYEAVLEAYPAKRSIVFRHGGRILAKTPDEKSTK